MGEVVWLCRYPVKSLLGEPLDAADLDGLGLVGDRRHALIDPTTGLVASAKHPRKWASLLTLSARLAPDGRPVIHAPDGTPLDTDAAVSAQVGRPVQLTATRPPHPLQLERETPPMEAGAGTMTRNTLGAGASFVDFGAVHLVTTATLAALGDADARRFRPNLVLRMMDGKPFEENGWMGRTLSIGRSAVLRMIVPTPRCVVPSLAHGALAPDRELLGRAARLNRVPVFDAGRLTCVGAYGAIERHGRLAVGDRVLVT